MIRIQFVAAIRDADELAIAISRILGTIPWSARYPIRNEILAFGETGAELIVKALSADLYFSDVRVVGA